MTYIYILTRLVDISIYLHLGFRRLRFRQELRRLLFDHKDLHWAFVFSYVGICDSVTTDTYPLKTLMSLAYNDAENTSNLISIIIGLTFQRKKLESTSA